MLAELETVRVSRSQVKPCKITHIICQIFSINHILSAFRLFSQPHLQQLKAWRSFFSSMAHVWVPAVRTSPKAEKIASNCCKHCVTNASTSAKLQKEERCIDMCICMYNLYIPIYIYVYSLNMCISCI